MRYCRRTDLCTLLTAALLVIALAALACEIEESDFVDSLYQEWTLTGADGATERVLFEPNKVTWNYQTDKAYSCPYRVTSFFEKQRTIDINLQCRQRTGTVSPVGYQLKLSEEGDTFSLLLQGRSIGVYQQAEASSDS